ncbi:hypothetical protein ABZX75_19365 [Streptomyces sp. NPDC003038]|uniref:hypothetical protein n=1 Tax=unclassified Streptomyces TaxID=2593676 RepID=UPI00339E5322
MKAIFLQRCSALIVVVAMAAAAGCMKGPDRLDAAPLPPTVPPRVANDPLAKFDPQGGAPLPWEAHSGLLSAGGTSVGADSCIGVPPWPDAELLARDHDRFRCYFLYENSS